MDNQLPGRKMGLSNMATLWSDFESLPEGITQSPQFLSWWRDLGKVGQSLVLSALRMKFSVLQSAESERFLMNLHEECSRRLRNTKQLTLSDFEGRKGSSLRELKRVLNVLDSADPKMADRRYGAVSHQVLPLVLEGQVPARFFDKQIIDVSEPSLFDEEVVKVEKWEQDDFGIHEPDPTDVWPQLNGTKKLYELPEVVLSDLEREISKFDKVCELYPGDWQKQYDALRGSQSIMEKMLRPIMGEFLEKLTKYHDPWADFQLLQTLIIWARPLVQVARERTERIFFKEINALDRRKGLSGGRIDALELVSIEGRDPTSVERSHLRKLARERFYSSGHLISYLQKLFGPRIEVSVIDWKCAVGDFSDHSNKNVLVNLDACPQGRHVKQMNRYLSFIPLDLYLLSGRKDEKIWASSMLEVSRARLTYSLATHPQFENDVTIDEEKAEEVLAEYARKWHQAEVRGETRVITNQVINSLVKNFQATKKVSRNENGHRADAEQTKLVLPDSELENVSSVISRHRKFVDPGKIVEMVSSQWGNKYILYYDELLHAIERGEIVYSSFDSEVGGRICCLNPQHDDHHPDMRVSVERGSFHCFACGFSGKIAEGSLTPSQLEAFAGSSKISGNIDNVVIPRECDVLFERVQRFASGSFEGSSAERYLVKERHLNPDIAFEHGAGYMSDDLVPYLLKLGYSLEDLVSHGLIKFGAHITKGDRLVCLLRDYGFKLKDLTKSRRVLGGKIKDDMPCLPYLFLWDCLTFPLKLEGKHTNFYGRRVSFTQKHMRHRKLQVKSGEIRVSQGGFNTDVLTKCQDVTIAEAAIEALTLVEMGYPNVIATVGTNNSHVLAAVTRYAKAAQLAYNHDKAGWEATGKAMKFFRERNFLTEDFENYSDLSRSFFYGRDTAIDFNEWWKTEKGITR